MHRNAFIYVAVVLGALAIALDFASIDLALPALERQFSLDLASVQWVINGYVLAFAVLMVAGGKFADAYGRKKVFLIGMGVFALASLLGGFAWSGASVIAFRVLQGVGAAMLWPAMIGMACGAVKDVSPGFVLGLIFGSCSLGNAAGPVVGGALTEWFSWRWVLWINVPMAFFAIAMTIWKVPEDAASAQRPRNDYAGMAALTGGLVALMMVVYQGGGWGWTSAISIGCIAMAVVLIALFPLIERRAVEPLIPPEIMRSREMLTLCCCAFVICQLFFVVLLYFTQYAMKFLGDGPVAGGARVVQFMLAYGVVSYFGGPLVKLFGARNLLIGGLIAAAVASAWLGICGPGASPISFNGALILLGISVGAVIPTVSARAIETAGTERASLVSGITFMCQLSGSALMLAVNTAIFTAVSFADLTRVLAAEHRTVTPAESVVISGVISGAQSVHQLPAFTAANLPHLAAHLDHAYRNGLEAVLWVSAGLVLIVLLMVLRFVPRRRPSPETV
ncbi:MAG: MFS transporter [Chthoniobacterales bacterium]